MSILHIIYSFKFLRKGRLAAAVIVNASTFTPVLCTPINLAGGFWMSKRKKKLFIQLHHDLYDSKEWRSLQWYSKLAYLRIKRKYNPNNGEKTSVSYREMTDEMSQPTFGKAIKELIKVGFIEVVQKGGLYRKRNYYILSYRWKTLKVSPLLKT